jgi:hypothetical protein
MNTKCVVLNSISSELFGDANPNCPSILVSPHHKIFLYSLNMCMCGETYNFTHYGINEEIVKLYNNKLKPGNILLT